MTIAVDLAKWRDLTIKQIGSANVRAMNRAAVSTRVEVVRVVQVDVPSLKSGDIKKLTTIDRAKSTKGGIVTEATLTVKDVPVGLEKFGAREKRVRLDDAGLRKGVTVKIKERRVLVRGGFLFRMAGGGVGIAKRTTDSRGPIKRLFGPGIARVAGSQWVLPRLAAYARSVFVKNFEHELSFLRNKQS